MRLRRALRTLILTTSFLLMVGGVAPPSDAEPENAQRIHFEYGIVGRAAGVIDSLFAVQDGCRLRSGDEINITVHRAVATFFYVVLHLSDGDYSLFHTASVTESDGETTESLTWLQLDDEKGTETIYLIASQHPLAGLEETVAAYASARGAERALLEESIDRELESAQAMGRSSQMGTMLPLARFAKRSSIGWDYRGPFEEGNLSQYLVTRCSGDSIVCDVVHILHQ